MTNPYRLARQEHVGDMLDELARRGRLGWKWDYNFEKSRAIYRVAIVDKILVLDTKKAEELVQRECDELGIRWKPVPHPGGQSLRDEVNEWIANPEAP